MSKLKKPHLRLLKNDDVWELLVHDMAAYKLLTIIAWRAKRKDCFSVHGLEIGEALIGDWEACGFSSEKVYRNARKRLCKYGIISEKRADRGMVVKLIGNTFFDINDEKGAIKGRTVGDHGATNKKGKKGKNINNINIINREKLSESELTKLSELEEIALDQGVEFRCTPKNLERLLREFAFSRVKTKVASAADWCARKGEKDVTALRVLTWLDEEFSKANDSEKAAMKPGFATEQLRKAAEKDLKPYEVQRGTVEGTVAMQQIPTAVDEALEELMKPTV